MGLIERSIHSTQVPVEDEQQRSINPTWPRRIMRATNNPVPFGCHGRHHHPPLEILAELRQIEPEILQGIEELEGMLR